MHDVELKEAYMLRAIGMRNSINDKKLTEEIRMKSIIDRDVMSSALEWWIIYKLYKHAI